MPDSVSEWFYRVSDLVRLETRKDYCLVIDDRRGVFDVLHPAEALLLSLLDGATPVSALAEMMGTIYRIPPERAQPLTHAALAKAGPYLEKSRMPMIVAKRFDARDFVFPGFEDPPGRSRPFDTPLSAVLVLTWQCNFRCRYCYFGTHSQPADVLPRAAALRVIREAADLGVVTLHFGGGEPLLYPHLSELVEAASTRNVRTSFSTNGALLTSARIRQLKDAGLSTIQVSLDSSVPAVHDAMTQSKGTFPKIVSAIRELKAMGFYVRVRSVITADNIAAIPELLDLLGDLAVDEVDLGPPKCGSCEVADAPPEDSLDIQGLDQIRRAVRDHSDRFAKGCLRFGDTEPPWRNHEDLVYCGNLTASMVILPTGRVCACELIRFTPDLSYGDIHEATLREIWLGPRHRALLASSTDPTGIDPECARCTSLPYCRTGCMNRSRLATGSFWGKDPRCPGPDVMVYTGK